MLMQELSKLLIRAHANAEATKNPLSRELAKQAFEHAANGNLDLAERSARRSFLQWGTYGKTTGTL